MKLSNNKISWSMLTTLLLLSLLCCINFGVNCEKKVNDLVIVTVATQITDGFVRFNRSVNVYGHKLEILGLNEEWKGGDIVRRPGGGQKILLLKDYLETVKDRDNLVVLFTDSYDVILTGGTFDILKRFESFDANVVFSSEKYCWPDVSLESQYPKSDGKRYLNSGAFVGYASSLYSIVSNSPVKNTDDDQLYYTKIYLDSNLRKNLNIKLDSLSFLFQNMNGVLNDLEIRFTQGQIIDETNADAFLFNKVFQTKPLIIHGNGNSKVTLNSLGNYLAKMWHPATGCLSGCFESRLNLGDRDPKSYPHIMIAANILRPTPFFHEFIEYISLLNYPKSRISLFIQSLTNYHGEEVEQFMDDYKSFYQSIRFVVKTKWLEWKLRNNYIDECLQTGCDYLFVVDSDVRITNPETLRILVEDNKPIIAPVLSRPNELWSNFWGALTQDGFYSRSHDYVQIVQNERRGIWNVPHISQAYLINATLFHQNENRVYNFKPLTYLREIDNDIGERDDDQLDPDMTFCKLLRDNGVFMFATNIDNYGHLANMDLFDVSKKNPDMYEIHSNPIEWKRRYIHENYSQLFNGDTVIEQPCPDVYWFPVVTPLFCKHLIEMMNHFGQWSAGKNEDLRLDGGYENVPTRDIHMKQVDFEQHWLYFLREYIRPIQEKVFAGYFHDPPKAIMNFVVRYHPEEQANLRPHHDASTYTINMALNSANIDYEGGGCRFLRYNCSLTNLRLGWSLIHPGRLTHFHEGLTVTKGVRYIMVSFVDP